MKLGAGGGVQRARRLYNLVLAGCLIISDSVVPLSIKLQGILDLKPSVITIAAARLIGLIGVFQQLWLDISHWGGEVFFFLNFSI